MKYFSHLVITAGISAISNRNALGKMLRQNPGPLRFEEAKQNPELREGATTEEAELHALEISEAREAFATLTQDPRGISAEYSLLHTLRCMGQLHERPTVVLLHTNTLSGRIAAHAVAGLAKRAFDAQCRLSAFANFDTSSREALQEGLGAFMDKVVHELNGVDPSYACFAPQGGYKVMTSLGYVAGSLLGYSTAYLHEDSQATLHIIPAIPIALSPEKRDSLGRLARVVERTAEFFKLSQEEQDDVLEHRWLFEVADDLVVPNALAKFLGLNTQQILLSPEARAALKASHRAEQVRRKLLELPGKIRERRRNPNAFLNEIDHERDFQNLNRPGNKPVFQIWKAGANIYVVWTERGDGAVLVNRIWVDDHAGYEDAADHATPSNSMGLFDDVEIIVWTPLPEAHEVMTQTAAQKNKSLNAVSPPASSVRELQSELRALNRQLHEKSKNAAEHKKHLTELRKENLELKNDLTILRAVLASRLPGPE